MQIATNFNIDIEFESPPFYRRLLAWVIDLLIQIFYFIIALRFLNGFMRNSADDLDSRYNYQWLYLIILVPFLVYHLVLEMEAFKVGVKDGVKIVIGLVPVFGIAAFFEGFVTGLYKMPLILNILILLVSAVFIVWYFIILPIKVRKLTRQKSTDTVHV